jgi:hypothetical protein
MAIFHKLIEKAIKSGVYRWWTEAGTTLAKEEGTNDNEDAIMATIVL